MLTGCARKNNRINSTHSWLAGPGPVCTRGLHTGEERRPGEDVHTRDALPHDIDDTAESLDSSLCLAFSREVFDSVAAEMPVSGSSPRLALPPPPCTALFHHFPPPPPPPSSYNPPFIFSAHRPSGREASTFISIEIHLERSPIISVSSPRLVRRRASGLSDVSIKTVERNYLVRNDNRE